MDWTEIAIGVDLANITTRVIILLFIKNLYNNDIRWQVASTKTINMSADALK